MASPSAANHSPAATIELTVPIIEKVRAAIFYDTGFVNAKAYDYGFRNLASDVGIGLASQPAHRATPARLRNPDPERQATEGGGKFNFNVGYQF